MMLIDQIKTQHEKFRTPSLEYFTNLKYDCVKLNRDMLRFIKPTTYYQLSSDFTDMRKDVEKKTTEGYDPNNYYPWTKVNDVERTAEEVVKSRLPQQRSILDEVILNQHKSTKDPSCRADNPEYQDLFKDYTTLSYEHLMTRFEKPDYTPNQLRGTMVKYLFQFMVNSGLIEDSATFRAIERTWALYPHLFSSVYLYRLYDKTHKGFFGLDVDNTNILFGRIYQNILNDLLKIEKANNEYDSSLVYLLNFLKTGLEDNQELIGNPAELEHVDNQTYNDATVRLLLQTLIYTLLGIPLTLNNLGSLEPLPKFNAEINMGILARFGVPLETRDTHLEYYNNEVA